MRTRSSSNLVGNSSFNPTTSNPKRRNCIRSNQRVELFALEESLIVTMAIQRTMAELLRAPTEGYAEAIVVSPILAEHFELKHSLINMMTSDQFFGLEKDNPQDHIRWFNKITSTIKYKDVPNHAIKLMLFPFSLAGAARRTTNLRNEISNFQQKFDESFHEAWDRYKDLLRACPHHGFTELHQLDTFYNALNPSDQDSLNSAAGGNLLERMKSSDGNSSSSDIAKLTHAVNQQTSVVTTAMTAILKQFQATPPPASVKAVEEICVTCGGPHPYYQCLAADGNTFPEYRDNIQGYVAAAAGNYNQGNAGYRPPGVVNQTRPPGFVQQNGQNNQNRFSQPQGYNRGNNFNQNANYQALIQQNQSVPLSELEKFKKMNDVNMKAMQAQINNVKNELRNEMQSSIQASMSNQTNELKNMMASFFQMNTASTSGTGSLPSNTVANPKGELKAITTQSGLVLDGPTVHMPFPFINPEDDERVEETLTDPEHGEYTIKVLSPQVQKAKPPFQRNFVIHQRDPRYPHIPYPSRMNQEKKKDEEVLKVVPHGFVIFDLETLSLSLTLLAKNLTDRLIYLKEDLGISRFAHEHVVGSKNLLDRVSSSMLSVFNTDVLDLHLACSLTGTYQSRQLAKILSCLLEEQLLEPALNVTVHCCGREFRVLNCYDQKSFCRGGARPELLNSNPSSLLPPFHNSLSGSTTSSSPSLHISEISDYFLEEFADELALITFPPGNDDLSTLLMTRENPDL
ncbi:reverse transcriptase domain-containing protein [Tanacetum coccineum]